MEYILLEENYLNNITNEIENFGENESISNFISFYDFEDDNFENIYIFKNEKLNDKNEKIKEEKLINDKIKNKRYILKRKNEKKIKEYKNQIKNIKYIKNKNQKISDYINASERKKRKLMMKLLKEKQIKNINTINKKNIYLKKKSLNKNGGNLYSIGLLINLWSMSIDKINIKKCNQTSFLGKKRILF